MKKNSTIIKPPDVETIAINTEEISSVLKINTQPQILTGVIDWVAEPILPDNIGNFDELLLSRGRVSGLKLCPIKLNEDRELYTKLSKVDLISDVESSCFGDESEICLASNKYPYFLPPDVDQRIVWMKDSICDFGAASFIARCCKLLNIDLSELVLFERPRSSTAILVRGTLPQIRHIHMWTRGTTS